MSLSNTRGLLLSNFLRSYYRIIPTRNIETDGKIPQDNDLPTEMENPFEKEKIECILCKLKIQADYKNTKLLSQFVSPYTGRIYGRHITGLCRAKQEEVHQEILKARSAGFMPYYNKEPAYLEDPHLFNPARPLRPHDF